MNKGDTSVYSNLKLHQLKKLNHTKEEEEEERALRTRLLTSSSFNNTKTLNKREDIRKKREEIGEREKTEKREERKDRRDEREKKRERESIVSIHSPYKLASHRRKEERGREGVGKEGQ